jgi:hypothetical protein
VQDVRFGAGAGRRLPVAPGLPDLGHPVTGYQIMVRHLIELIGNVKLVDLKVRDVQFALGKLAERLSTRSVRLARMILIQAIRNAVGHSGTRTTEVVYRHQLRPVTRTAAIALGPLFESIGKTNGGQL